jgi:hypothetical protein
VEEYACIYAKGTLVRDTVKKLIEKKLVLKADLIEVFPVYLKNSRAKIGTNDTAALLIVERLRLDEVMAALRSEGQVFGPLSAFSFPVIGAIGISG